MRERNSSRIRRTAPSASEIRIAQDTGRFYGPDSPKKTRFRLRSPSEETAPHKASASSSVRVAIQEQVQFPTHQGIVSAQRVRILRIKQSANSPDEQFSSHLQHRKQSPSLPKSASRHQLPSQPMETGCWVDGKYMCLRAIGEIAAGEDGNFYEVQGQQTRPLGELVMDEQGRVFEVHSDNGIQDTGTTKENSNRRSGPKRSGERPDWPAKGNGTDTSNQAQAHAPPPLQSQEKQSQSEARAQKTHAVQQSTREAQSKAQVNRSHPAQSQEEESQPHLWPVTDPIAVMGKDSGGQSIISAVENPVPRRAIPEKFMDPLQFSHSREEVLYDMKSMLGTLPPKSSALVRWLIIYPLRRLKTFIASISSRRSMKKWRAMLKGKSPEDQLWSVTPPRDFSYLPAVRYWAEERLAWAGYDPERMLLEWEIFWRRKGFH